MSERYRLLDRAGVILAELPGSAHPSSPLGPTYDLHLRAGAHSQRWHLEGTGLAQPVPLALTMTIKEADEVTARARVQALTDAARIAAALTRDGSPPTPLLGLQSAQSRPLALGNSTLWELTLTLLPAAPGQSGGVPGAPPPGPVTGTASLTLSVMGVAGGAPLTVTNITTGGVVYQGTLAGSVTIPGLTAGHQFRAVPGTVEGYTAPEPRTTTLPPSGTAMTFTYSGAGAPPPDSPPPDTGYY